MKKKPIPIIIAAAVLLCGIAGIMYFHNNYIAMDEQVFRRNETSLNLSGQTLAEPEKLSQLSELVFLDLTDTGMTAQQYDTLRSALPQCDIRWSVPFQGTLLENTTSQLAVTELTEEDIRQLAYFPQLTAVDAAGCQDYEMIAKLTESYPKIAVTYRLDLGSQHLSPTATHITLGDGTVDQLREIMPYLPQLQWVNAAGCTDYAALEELQQQYPNCKIVYTVELAGKQLQRSVTTLNLDYSQLPQLEAVLPYLPHVTTVNVTGNIPSNDDMLNYQLTFPDVDFNWSFRLFDLEVTSLDKEIDLSNIPMESTHEVEAALKYFRNLQRVVMCDCGISDEEMDALGKRNPDVRFVWTVSIGRHVRLRTDATYFMPYQYGSILSDSETTALKYCVDLICLDVGHMEISDISFLQNMPHMKYLLLADTNVSDISALSGLTELVYLELFLTDVTDYTPLITCTSLEDLNISYATPTDIDPLCQMPQLKNLWMKGYWRPEGKARLAEALPNTRIEYGVTGVISSTQNGWRQLQNYYDMRDLLGMPYND